MNKPTDRIILAKLTGKRRWSVIDDKRPGYAEKAMSTLLLNACNKYAEYENCGVKYRMIRRSQCTEYMIPADCPGISVDQLHA